MSKHNKIDEITADEAEMFDIVEDKPLKRLLRPTSILTGEVKEEPTPVIVVEEEEVLHTYPKNYFPIVDETQHSIFTRIESFKSIIDKALENREIYYSLNKDENSICYNKKYDTTQSTILSINDNKSYKYIVVLKWHLAPFMKALATVGKNNDFSINEQIDLRCPFKFHLDIDPPKDKQEENQLGLIPKIIQRLIEINPALKDYLDYIVMGAVDYEKKYHLVFPNLIIPDGYTYFKLCDKLEDLLEDKRHKSYKTTLDDSKPKFSSLRILGSKKFHKSGKLIRTKVIKQSTKKINDINDCFITSYLFRDDCCGYVPLDGKYMIESDINETIKIEKEFEEVETEEEDIENTDKYYNLLNMLKPERYEDSYECLRLLLLGKKLKICKELLHTLSKKAKNYCEKWTENIINQYEIADIKINKYYLYKVLKEDVSADDYKKAITPKRFYCPNASCKNLGENFIKIYGDNFKIISKDEIYIWCEDTKLWELEKSPIRLIHIISDTFTPIYTELGKEAIKRMAEANKDADKRSVAKANVNLKQIQKAISSLTDPNYIEKIIKYIISIKQRGDKVFRDKIDNYRPTHLFPFGDKVFDFKTGLIREIRKDDYFTFTTSCEYKPVEEMEEKTINGYIGSLFNTTDKEHIDCFLNFLAYCLTGENHLKKIIVLKGAKGNNGKSTFLNLFKSIIEKFGVSGADRIFLETRAQSVHQAELFTLIGKRVSYICELTEHSSFNIPLMKEISGDDLEHTKPYMG